MDIWKGLKSVVAKGAPVLANAIVPGSGGLAASLIGKALGVDSNDPQRMMEAVQQASPEQWAQIRQAEMDHKKELAEIAADLDKAYLADRKDARSRDVQLKQAGYHNYRADIMLALAFITLIALTWMIWKKADSVPTQIFALFNMAIGMILKMLSDAFQFEFGSSRGSKEKDLKR